ncbi:hypothetical protein Ciccas_009426, partial [Cichlidogyrus casuarinus]
MGLLKWFNEKKAKGELDDKISFTASQTASSVASDYFFKINERVEVFLAEIEAVSRQTNNLGYFPPDLARSAASLDPFAALAIIKSLLLHDVQITNQCLSQLSLPKIKAEYSVFKRVLKNKPVDYDAQKWNLAE